MSSAERWAEIALLVDALLDAPPEARDALIETLSAGDVRRRAELQRLRAECEQDPVVLSRPVRERFAALLEGEDYVPAALRERYSLTRELGRGGMATVFLGRDERHARDVAVKVVHPLAAAALGRERFLAEIEMVAQMHHPHIVPLYDSGEADGALYYVMPYEPELSLRHRLARDGRLAPAEVVVFLRDVCDVLAYAHARGIVHSDIKPDNVLVSGRHALLADFGIARDATRSSNRPGPGFTLGTPAYMAPEQILGTTIDHRTDVYAVGLLGYELLAGRTPFSAERPHEMYRAHLEMTPPPLATLAPDAPRWLAALVIRCLAKRPEDRWQSAEELMKQLEASAAGDGGPSLQRRSRWRWAGAVTLAVAGVATAIIALRRVRAPNEWRSRWERMHIERVTDFPGSEVDATISRDGKRVAFLADREGVFDAYVTDVGSSSFRNLTNGRLPQLFNEDVRNVGLAPDGEQAWIRVAALTSPASVSLTPGTGGALQPFLPTAVMVAWSADGSRLAYHETTPGDPIFVAAADGRDAKRIYIAPPGVHSHHLSWSPDGRYLYFSHGLPPNEMDLWRIAATGGAAAERITRHNSRVASPVLLDDRTLLYTATDDDGNGPWLYLMDLRDRVPVRLSSGVEHVLSVAAGADVPGKARRLVVTVSNPKVTLWSVPIGNSFASEPSAVQLSLPTARSGGPRYAPDSTLLYLASRGGADALWRSTPVGAAELWRPREGTLAGAAVASPDGKTICAAVRVRERAALRCTELESGREWTLAEALDVRGAPSWSPDGEWIAMAARDGDATHVFKIPVHGGAPWRVVDSVSFDPVWSPDGRFILYSGTPRGRSVPVEAVRPDGSPFPLPFDRLIVDRLADSYRFLPNGDGLVVKLGGFRHQDFWLIDLRTGARRQLTQLRGGESVSRFDISRDGRQIVFERAEENSDVALIEVPRQ